MLLADVAPELAERNLPVWVILTLAAVITFLFGALMFQVAKTSSTQDLRIGDRDRSHADVAELSKSTAGIVEKNTQGLFVFTKELEAMRKELAEVRDELETLKPRRKPGPSPPAQGGTG